MPASGKSASGLRLVQEREQGRGALLRPSPSPHQLKLGQAGLQRAEQGRDKWTGSIQKRGTTLRTSVSLPIVPSTWGPFLEPGTRPQRLPAGDSQPGGVVLFLLHGRGPKKFWQTGKGYLAPRLELTLHPTKPGCFPQPAPASWDDKSPRENF